MRRESISRIILASSFFVFTAFTFSTDNKTTSIKINDQVYYWFDSEGYWLGYERSASLEELWTGLNENSASPSTPQEYGWLPSNVTDTPPYPVYPNNNNP